MNFTLNHWGREDEYKVRERVYVNIDGSRESIGYWEFLMPKIQLRPTTGYAKHRMAKGEKVDYGTPTLTWHGPAEYEEALLKAAEIVMNEDDTTAMYRFSLIAQKARNGYPSWNAKTPRRQIEKLKEARDSAVYTVELPTLSERDQSSSPA